MQVFSISGKIDRIIRYQSTEYLYFSGTSYLGIGSREDFTRLVLEGLHAYGIHHGASRSGNVRLSIYQEMESFFAQQAKAEKALLFSSGYMAGMAAVQWIQEKTDMALIAPDTHPAILPPGSEVDSSQTFETWTRDCAYLCNQVNGKKIAIIGNAVNPLFPQIHAYDWIKTLNPDNQYYLLIDDSHAFGVLGEGIFGTYSLWKDLPASVTVAGSLGKGLGIPAGIVLGVLDNLEEMEKTNIFRSSSPPAPAPCSAFIHGQDIYRQQKEKLMDNIQYFLDLIAPLDWLDYAGGFPVFSFPDHETVYKLQKDHILVSSFPYPKPSDIPVNRIILSAYHELQDLHKLAKSLMDWTLKSTKKR